VAAGGGYRHPGGHRQAPRSPGRRRKKLTALLAWQAGIQYEGETEPDGDPGHYLAIRAWRLLSNGMGGMDWAGLPLVCEMLGVTDAEALICRMQVIRNYKPNENQDGTRATFD
jgi:hypothetical protein